MCGYFRYRPANVLGMEPERRRTRRIKATNVRDQVHSDIADWYSDVTSNPFRLPKHGLSFPLDILARSLDLIGRGIWSGIKPVRLNRWFKNFGTEEERYFAACVLDHLIYRSDEQTTALAVHLFHRSLVDLARLDPPKVHLTSGWLEQLRDAQSSVRLVAAVKRADYTHKSAYLISRLMKRQLGVRPQWIAKAWELNQHLKTGAQVFIFIDDFLGTGRQFEELVQQENLDWMFASAYVVYAPFAAHRSGIDYLKKRFPVLRIASAEILDERHDIFDSRARCFDDSVNTPEAAKAFYLDLIKRKGLTIQPSSSLGFGGLGLAYVFEHAVPDNNLPIFWSPGPDAWSPLFDR
jgi:hypothetical protein